MTEEQKQCCIVQTAAKIIKNAIKEVNSNNNSYPSPDGMESYAKNVEYLPKSLCIFLDNLLVRKEKSVQLATIGLAIMQQVWSKALIVTLQLGLCIQVHQHFASMFLIDWLNKHFLFHTVKFSSMNIVQLCTRELKFLVCLNLVQLNQYISGTM